MIQTTWGMNKRRRSWFLKGSNKATVPVQICVCVGVCVWFMSVHVAFFPDLDRITCYKVPVYLKGLNYIAVQDKTTDRMCV